MDIPVYGSQARTTHILLQSSELYVLDCRQRTYREEKKNGHTSLWDIYNKEHITSIEIHMQ
jgi:hypothetical protein